MRFPTQPFEPSFCTGWAHTRKNINPKVTTKVTNVIHKCWKTGESKELGNVKISADGVFVRLEEMPSQKMIRSSELPLAGKIRAIYKRIGTSSQPLSTGGRKQVRLQNDRGKKSRISFEELDVSKELLKWTKPELEAYLIHHQIKKTGQNWRHTSSITRSRRLGTSLS